MLHVTAATAAIINHPGQFLNVFVRVAVQKKDRQKENFKI
jgi:hypothetical protein